MGSSPKPEPGTWEWAGEGRERGRDFNEMDVGLVSKGGGLMFHQILPEWVSSFPSAESLLPMHDRQASLGTAISSYITLLPSFPESEATHIHVFYSGTVIGNNC